MNSKMNETKNLPGKIAVIGPSQSGKTCLAVGLFATSTSDFTIEHVDKEVQSYLGGLSLALHPKKDGQGNLKPGVWPEATNLGTVKSIRLDFCKKGKKPIRVDFPEFSGELLESDEKFTEFANAHFRGLDGVVLLINPGADAFQSGNEQHRADVMAQYKKVLSYLRDPNNESDKAFIALTVTASDRVSGDLKGKLVAFDQSVEELSNTIGTSGFKSKRFWVTVTGQLKNQGNPTLAKGRGNLASEPFLWLLDELQWRPRREAVMRKIGKCILAAGGLAALAGIGCGMFALNELREIEKDKIALEDAIEKARDPNSKELEAIRNILVKLSSRAGFFAEKAKGVSSSLEPRVWCCFETCINKEINNIARDPEKYCNDSGCNRVDSLFIIWIPTNHKVLEKYEDLKKTWENIKLLEFIRKPLIEKANLHGEEAFVLFDKLYGKLATITISTNANELKKEVASNLDARVAKEWQDSTLPYFDKTAAEQATEDNIDKLQKRLKDWNPVTQSGIEAKESLLANVTNSIPRWRGIYVNKQKDKDNDLKAKCTDWVSQNVFSGRPRSDQNKNGIWDAYKQVCQRPMAKDNPYFNEIVRAAVYREAENWLEDDVAVFREALAPSSGKLIWEDYDENRAKRIKRLDATFQKFWKTCDMIAGFKSHPHPENSWAYRFATLCIEQGKINRGFSNAFPQCISVTNLDVAIDYKGSFPIFYGGTAFAAWFEVYSTNPDGSFNNDVTKFEPLIAPTKDGHAPIDGETQNVLGKADENQLKNIWDKGKTFDVGLFQYCKFLVLATDYNNGWGNSYKYDGNMSAYLKFPCEDIDAKLSGKLYVNRNSGKGEKDIHAKITLRIEGDTPFSLLEVAKREVQGKK